MIRVSRSRWLLATSILAASPALAQNSTNPARDSQQPQAADVIVTAQKREQRIQDVPVAISAFSGRTLDAMKIETGGDLLKSIPNVTFSKNNFAGYNFSIRGIGTKAVAVSTDPAVAVAFNSSNLITNRLFEQEFFDIERVEVLRGPQGTLYGRNATAGVVNIISKRADLTQVEGFVKLEGGNYGTQRASWAANLPLVGDRLAIRAAGAYTRRSGFDYNDFYGTRINGRDLWSTRVTLSARPVDPLRIDLIWEHFNEDDDRQRAGKQLCHKDAGPASVGGVDLTEKQRGALSQGCLDGSLYVDAAFSTPNGRSLSAFQALQFVPGFLTGVDATTDVDPYGGQVQSRSLRHFAAQYNPTYRAKADVFEANATLDLGPVSLVSQTLYNRDRYASTEDYYRFVSVPIFGDSNERYTGLDTPGGFFTDPQLGRSDRLLSADLIRSKSSQFSQELRLQSDDPAARLQYVVGGNYTHYKTLTDYNVYINAVTATNVSDGFQQIAQFITTRCGPDNPGNLPCVYVDPNPIGVGPADGHNYFRSINPYRLRSWGVFADVNYALTPNFKLIAGTRNNNDDKRFERIPSELLLGTSAFLAGTVDRGYPSAGFIDQRWNRVTGRAGFQWTPALPFTDASMIYATYSRGYKAGGANPPGVGFGSPGGGFGNSDNGNSLDFQGQQLASTFRPEYLNAFELGIKNTAFGGRLTFNATGFYYDYKDYQVSQIIDRSSQNENFDAIVYGAEFELVANPFRGLAVNANLGLEKSRIANGERSIDVFNRTQGDPNYLVVKPFVVLPSNCVANVIVVQAALASGDLSGICQGAQGFSVASLVDPANYPGNLTVEDLYPNQGRGFYADLSGNELPNTPRLTLNVGAQYTIPLGNGWGIVARGDVYHQSGSYARVYNDVGDRLHGWENVNLSLRLGNERLKFLAEVYLKNALNATPITDAFLNSDDTGLTTNVFTLDPRIIGINFTKGF